MKYNGAYYRVSIIIPCYNASKYIEQCINSVLQQDYPNIEIVVVDDGSSDDSLQKLQKFKDKIILLEQSNSGACVARNKGLDISTGEYIKFLDADDYLADNIISAQVKQLNELDQQSIVYGDYTLVYRNSNILHKNKIVNNSCGMAELFENDLLTSTPLHRKQLLQNIDGFDERFKHGQEWNLHIRLAASGVKFIYYADNIYFYRIHNSVDRISVGKKFDAEYEVKKVMMTWDYIKKLQVDDIETQKIIAKKIWLIGRMDFQSNCNKEVALKYFKLAHDIYPDVLNLFSKKYRILSTLIGKFNTEKVVSRMKRILGSKNIFIDCKDQVSEKNR